MNEELDVYFYAMSATQNLSRSSAFHVAIDLISQFTAEYKQGGFPVAYIPSQHEGDFPQIIFAKFKEKDDTHKS